MSTPASEEYLRGYRDALVVALAKIRDDPHAKEYARAWNAGRL